MAVIIHAYTEPNLKKLVRNEEFDCTTCGLAKKVRSLDGVDEYLCRASLYDIKTLACHVPKYHFAEEDGADNG